MRQNFCIFSLFISMLTFGQSEFYIHIETDVDVDEVVLSSFNLSEKFTSEFVNGIAIVQMPSETSDQYSIFIEGKRIDAWFNSGKIDIYLDFKENTLSVSKTINTPVYERQLKYFNDYGAYLNNKSLGTEFIKKAILDNDQDAFILVPINHYLKLFQNNKDELNFIEEILKKQPKSTREHSIYQMIESRLEKLREIKRIALNDYLLIDTNGKESTIKTEQNKKYRVLDFWFTSCPPCIKEHNHILKNPDLLEGLDTELIGISIDENQEKWVGYLERKNVSWKNYRIAKSRLDKDLGIWSFPTYVIIDNENNIVGSYSNIADTIEALKE